MLFFDQSRTVPGAVLFRGFRGDGAPCWFALPEDPRLASAGGVPRLQYRLYVPALGSVSLPSGWLSLGLDLRGTDDERLAWAAAVGVEASVVECFPATSATVSIEHGGVELARVPALRVGPDLRVAASVEGEEALLLWAALAAERPALVARVVLSFHYQLAATRIRVWAERSGRPPAERPEEELQAMLTRGRAGVIVEPESPLSPELQAALEARAQDLLAAACASASTESFSLELSLHEVYAGSLTIGGVLTAELADPTTHLHRVDLSDAIARPVTLGVVCPAFESALLSAVHIQARHPAEGTARRTEEFLLDSAGGDHLYAAVATREESDEVAVAVRVWLRDAPEPWERPELRMRSGAILVIDPDRCGVLRVEVSASGASWGEWQRAEVELSVGAPPASERPASERPAGDQTARLLLDPGARSRVWEAVVRADPPPAATMRTRWMAADGRWTDPEVRVVGAGRCFIAPPVPAQTSQVALVAAGDWTDLERVVVEVAAPDDDAVRAVFTFTDTGQQDTWRNAVRPYRVRVTVVGGWGAATGAWEPHDDALLVVMDRERLAVEIVPTLLGLGEHVRLARVELEDRSGTHDPPAHAAFTFTTPTQATWRYRAGGGIPVYRWRLLLVRPDGARVDADWREGRGEVLVLTPTA